MFTLGFTTTDMAMSTRSQDKEETTFEMDDERACLPKRKCTQIDFNKSKPIINYFVTLI